MSVVLTGFKEYAEKLKNAPEGMRKRVAIEVQDAAEDWRDKAVNAAPADVSFLRRGITAMKDGAGWSVVSAANYSAYMEWGTRSLTQIPAELASYASEFKGSTGGTFEQLVKNMEEWVRRKGIAKGKDIKHVAYAIALKIVRVGVRPQPFFFIHKLGIQQRLLRNLKTIVDNI